MAHDNWMEMLFKQIHFFKCTKMDQCLHYLEVSLLQAMGPSHKMVYICEHWKAGNLGHIYLKLENVQKLRRLQSGFSVFKHYIFFSISLFSRSLCPLHAKARNPHSHRTAAIIFQSYSLPHSIPANKIFSPNNFCQKLELLIPKNDA